MLVLAGTGLIAATYGLVRLAYGLVLPDMQTELGFGAGTAGLLSAGASVMYCIAAAAGFLWAAGHARALVVGAGATAAVGSFGMAAAPSTTVLGLSVVLASAGAGLASPAMVQVLRRNLGPERADRAQAVVNAGTGPGLVAAGVLALVLLPGWRSVWIVAGLLTAVMTVLVLLRDRRATATSDSPAPLPRASWFAGHVRVIVAALLLGAGSAAVWNSGRALLVHAGSGRTLSVVAWIALGVGGAAVIGTAGRFGRIPARVGWAVASAAVALATAALVAVPGNAVVALLACVVFGWGYTAATGALIAWTAEIDPDRAPSGTALLFVLLVLGQAVGAALAGAAIGGAGYGPAFLGSAVACAVAAVLGVRVPWRRTRAVVSAD